MAGRLPKNSLDFYDGASPSNLGDQLRRLARPFDSTFEPRDENEFLDYAPLDAPGRDLPYIDAFAGQYAANLPRLLG